MSPLPSLFGILASTGRIVLPAPTITRHTVAGQFVINNYDSGLTYALTGSASRSGNIITLSGTTSSGTITQKAPKGILASTAVTMQRSPITYYSCNCYIADSFQTTGGCPGGYNYEDYGWVQYCRLYACNTCENAPPSGWLKTNGEWTRIA